MNCDKCGKDMTDPEGKDGGLVNNILSTKNIGVAAHLDFWQKQMGKYELDRTYTFCWECWLDSLFGVKTGG